MSLVRILQNAPISRISPALWSAQHTTRMTRKRRHTGDGEVVQVNVALWDEEPVLDESDLDSLRMSPAYCVCACNRRYLQFRQKLSACLEVCGLRREGRLELIVDCAKFCCSHGSG